MTALGIAMVGFGILFVAAGVKDLDPRTLVLDLFTGETPKKIGGAIGGNFTPAPEPGSVGTGGGGGGSGGW